MPIDEKLITDAVDLEVELPKLSLGQALHLLSIGLRMETSPANSAQKNILDTFLSINLPSITKLTTRLIS